MRFSKNPNIIFIRFMNKTRAWVADQSDEEALTGLSKPVWGPRPNTKNSERKKNLNTLELQGKRCQVLSLSTTTQSSEQSGHSATKFKLFCPFGTLEEDKCNFRHLDEFREQILKENFFQALKEVLHNLNENDWLKIKEFLRDRSYALPRNPLSDDLLWVSHLGDSIAKSHPKNLCGIIMQMGIPH